MPDEALSNKAKDRHADESTQKRTPSVQAAREDSIRDRLAAARLHGHGYLGRWGEGDRRIPRYSARVHHYPVGRPAAPMPTGMADRLRTRRAICRLIETAQKNIRKTNGLPRSRGGEAGLGVDVAGVAVIGVRRPSG